MTSDVHIFDRALLKYRKNKAYPSFQEADFLHHHAASLVTERLQDITRVFPHALYVGMPVNQEIYKHWKDVAGIDVLVKGGTDHHYCDLVIDEEFIPFPHGALDIQIHNLNLHMINDLPGALVQMRRALKPDGLFIGAMLGGETLWQLRQVLQQSEMELTGGISSRIHPFADKQQMGALMQRAGFALPVVDSEIITVTYADMFKLMYDLRAMAETNIISKRSKTCARRDIFLNAAEKYAKKFTDGAGKIEATFELIFLTGWAPHESQQKPLKPGSAAKRLSETLGTQEITTGEKVSP